MAMEQVRDTPDPLDLDAVVDRAVAGDAVALDHLLGRVHLVAVRYCRSRMSAGHRSLASPDDVAQEVCMAVLTALPTFRHEGRPFLAFVYGICAHKVADAHRVAARSRTYPFAEVPDGPSADRGPEQRVVANSVSHLMGELLGHLPTTQQEIIRLRVGVGLQRGQSDARAKVVSNAIANCVHIAGSAGVPVAAAAAIGSTDEF